MSTKLILSLTLVLTSLAGFALWQLFAATGGAPQGTPSPLFQQAVQGAPAIGGGPFRLQDDKGNVVTEQNLIGEKYHMIFFGFANCPDVCPGMLMLMAGVEEKLPPAQREKLQFVFVSVDPNRDSLEKLGVYVRDFSPSFVGWTGEKAEIDRMVKNYLAYYAIKPAAEGAAPNDYVVDHSGFAYLIGPDGKYIAHYRSSDSAASLLANLQAALK